MKEFLRKFEQEDLISDDTTQLGREHYLPGKLRKYMNKKAVYVGEYLGKSGRTFKPSLSLIEKLNKQNVKKIYVNEKEEWLFIVGRDLFHESLMKKTKGIMSGDFVLVCNTRGECLGYGEYSHKKIAVRNLFDVGYLIRRERKK